jgi:hypothetical protein
MAHGPNVTKLITRYMVSEAIPAGGGIADGLRFFQDDEHRKQILERSERAVLDAIAAVKAAPDNPYGSDDELIAAAVLAKLAEKEGRKA